MRVLIGDNALNQMFLGVAARKAGLDDVATATTAEALILAAASGYDLIVFDPSLEQVARSPVDVVTELLRVVPRARLVVVSASSVEIARAASDGIRAARKQSLFRLQEIEETIADAAGRVADEVIAEHRAKLDLVDPGRPGSAGVDRLDADGSPGDDEADAYDWSAPMPRTSAEGPVLTTVVPS